MATQTSVLTKDASSLSSRYSTSEYEDLGRDLLQSMIDYTSCLHRENLPMPSLSPSTMETTQLKNEKGLQEKARIVKLAQQILVATQDPGTSLFLCSLQFHFCSCLKIIIDLKVGSHISKYGQISAEQLASATGAEQALLVRIMRVVMTKDVFMAPQPGFYSHTSISWAMQAPDMQHLLIHRLDEGFRSASREPDALRQSGYRNPTPDDANGFNLAFGYEGDYWHYITNSDAERGHNFNQAMKAVTINSLGNIPKLYPFASLAQDGGLVVDVGGGLGQVSREILRSCPGSGLLFIVQDKHATPSADEHNGINGCDKESSEPTLTLQQHDFFQPQPVIGAAAYLFRHIFHDWPDKNCIDILRQTVPAMDESKSRILICDQVVEDETPSVASVLYDVDMMSLFGGKERSLNEFRALIKEADARLYISDVKKLPESTTAMLVIQIAKEN